MKTIRFKFSPEKARAAIHWMAQQRPGIDLHALLKACYFADRQHLNQHGRPVFGATYRAMRFGPVPLEIYEMAKGDPIHLADLGADRFPWELRDGFRVYPRPDSNLPPDMNVLSDSDEASLRDGLSRSLSMTFNARTEATHGSDWQAAQLGFMRYEDMLDESPRKAEIVAYLRETAPYIRL